MRPRSLSREEKLAILEQLEAGRPPHLIMVEMKVSRQQVAAVRAWRTIRSKAKRNVMNEMGLVAYRYAKARAAKRGVPVLTSEEFQDLWVAQSGRCKLSGKKFSSAVVEPRAKVLSRPWFPSIDRIDPRGDYSRQNVRIVAQIVNIGLGEWPIRVFREMCRRIAMNLRRSRE